MVLSLVFAGIATPILLADSIAQPSIAAGQDSPMTVRVPLFAANECVERSALGRGSIVVTRGAPVTPHVADQAQCVVSSQPSGRNAALAYFVAMFLVALFYTGHLRASHGGRLLRTQTVLLAVVIAGAVITKVLLLATPVSLLLVPVAGIAAVTAVVVDRSSGLATGLLASVLFSCLTPFDAGVLSILVIQSIATVMLLADRERARTRARVVVATAFGGAAAAISYLVLYYLTWHGLPFGELAAPLNSAWIASGMAGVLAAGVALAGESPLRLLLGSVTKAKLVDLEDLSNPLLKQIATKAPGTWQHSLAMANMAESAANEIHANGRLVRVGAYYHDLGKSLAPKYFIENLSPGETSPHDRLDPEASCAAIFDHVVEGVRLGRKSGLPERIIDFMHMHHGDGLLEYFWAKCKDSGNPRGLSEDDFRYPGLRPHSRETAILAIVDAVEAASRTLKQPEESAIRSLVQRIVYGKLHLGQLDDSGLTARDLRQISNSLIETIKHAHHGRIEYPWQQKERQEAAARAAAGTETVAIGKAPRRRARTDITSRFAREPRLDSLDAPRPLGRQRPATMGSAEEPAPAAPGGQVETARPEVSDSHGPARATALGMAETERVLGDSAVDKAVGGAVGGAASGEPRKVQAVVVDSREEGATDPEVEVPAVVDGAVAAPGEAGTLHSAAATDRLQPTSRRGRRETREHPPVTDAPRETREHPPATGALQAGRVIVGPPPATRRARIAGDDD